MNLFDLLLRLFVLNVVGCAFGAIVATIMFFVEVRKWSVGHVGWKTTPRSATGVLRRGRRAGRS